jgi:hypothetical protein
MSNTKSSATPSIVEAFLATVRLFVYQSAPSAKTTLFPVVGVAGSVIVNAPPDVSAISLSPATAV